MKREELQFALETKHNLEFSFNGRTYILNYAPQALAGQSRSGATIKLGLLYDEGETFSSFTDLMVRAKIENHFLREILDDIQTR